MFSMNQHASILNQRLQTAMLLSDYAAAKKLVVEGADIKTIQLHSVYSAKKVGDLEFNGDFEFLVRVRVEAGLKNDEKDALLKVMAEKGCVKAATFLFLAGANPKNVDLFQVASHYLNNEITPTSKKKYFDFFTILIKAGVNKKGVVEELKKIKQDDELFALIESTPSPREKAALQNALKAGDFKTASKLLTEGADPEGLDLSNILSAQLYYSKLPHSDFLEFLRAHIHSPLIRKDILLNKLIYEGYLEASLLLLDAGAKANHVDLGQVISKISCSQGELKNLLAKLIKAEASKGMVYALQFAAAHELNDIVSLLLENMGDKVGALSEAVSGGYPLASDLLVKAGASVATLNLVTVLDECKRRGHGREISPGILTSLVQAASHEDKRRAMEVAVELGYIDAVKQLRVAGVSLNERAGNGRTWLFFSISNKKSALSEFLISEGSDINACSPGYDMTRVNPLLVACIMKQIPTALLLFAKGADVNLLVKAAHDNGYAPDFEGTVLQYFSHKPETSFKQIISLLTLWTEIDKVSKDATQTPKKRIESVLDQLIKYYTPVSSYFSMALSSTATLPPVVQKAKRIKAGVLEIGDGDKFLTNFIELMKKIETESLIPGTMDPEEQHLAAICQRLALHFGPEVGVKQHADILINDEYKGSVENENQGIELKPF
jgi:ankyrin repeat protein